MTSTLHRHGHQPNRLAVIPTHERLDANKTFTGRGVTIAFLDSGFYPHPDLVEPTNRVVAYIDLAGEHSDFFSDAESYSWQWHGTQTSVSAAGNGYLSDGVYRGLASESNLVLVKVSKSGGITEENIERGIRWVIDNKDRYKIRVLNISLGGDEDVPCSMNIIDQAAEEAIRQGIVVVVAAGNSGHEGKHSIPPANSPGVITVGGYDDNNRLSPAPIELYPSNFGFTADGTLKPEVIAPAMWVAAPILPGTVNYQRAEALSRLAAAADYQLPSLAIKLKGASQLPDSLINSGANNIRNFVESILRDQKIVSTHYQHVDGTSFAAPIVSSIVAQMLEANPNLQPRAVKDILISTAERVAGQSLLRQGYGVVNAKRAIEAALSEQHSVEVSSVTVVRDRVKFTYHNDAAASVALVGDFNQWNSFAHAFTKQSSGLWEVEIPIRPGEYQYKFLVNGMKWVEDPSNGLKATNDFGGLNSLLVISEER
jgi:serine protease AprX